MLWPCNEYWVERVSSERPIGGLSEQGDEAFDVLAAFRQVHGSISYGVFLRITEPIHRVQSSNCCGVTRAGALECGAKCPSLSYRAAKSRERGLLLALIGGRQSSGFDRINQ